MSETSFSKSKIVATLIAVATPVLISIFTPAGDYMANLLFPYKTGVDGTIVQNNSPMRQVDVFLDDSEEKETTDSNGRFIFGSVKQGAHFIKFTVNEKPETYSFYVTKKDDPKFLDAIDIDAELVTSIDFSTEEEEIVEEKVEKKKTQQTASEKPKNDPPPEPVTTVTTETAADSITAPVEVPEVEEPVASYSPQEVLAKVSLKVFIDCTDKSGKQKAFRYSLSGSGEILDQIKEVHYIRNHKTFSERINNTYQSAYNRKNNFEFSGYQWGSVQTTYVCVILANGEKSTWELKPISYKDNCS